MEFAYEALTADGTLVRDRVKATDVAQAIESLRSQALVVLQVEKATTPSQRTSRLGAWRGRQKVTERDLVLFTRQMKMLLEAGAAVVPALTTLEQQTAKPAFRSILHKVRCAVEDGGRLSEALRDNASIFTDVFCTMVAAGEMTGTLPKVFDRLSDLAYRRYQVRNTIVGAMIYPALVCVLSVFVIGLLLGFVVPRFRTLFLDLNAELPATTWFMLDCSLLFTTYWPVLLAAAVGLTISACLLSRNERFRAKAGVAILKVPLLGRLTARLIFASVLRVWAALLQSRVPLLEALQQSKGAIRNRAFLEVIEKVEEATSSGGHVGRTLAASPLVDPMLASAITTGEENGRLAEAVDFASTCADEDNAQLIGTVTRIVEPALIALLGLIVGLVAMALFLPIFDLATLAGG